jgi:hypothetical protein
VNPVPDATLGADLLWYSLGRLRGTRVLEILCRFSLDPDSLIRHAKERFAARPFWTRWRRARQERRTFFTQLGPASHTTGDDDTVQYEGTQLFTSISGAMEL